MNLFCFKENFLDVLSKDFDTFIHQDIEKLETGELILSDTAGKALKEGTLTLKNIVSNGMWTGVTYKEDLPKLQETIDKLIKEKEYPENLWD